MRERTPALSPDTEAGPARQGELPAGRRWRRGDALALLASVLVAVLLATAPHLASLVRFGTLEYLADVDDIAYLAISRVPYHGETVLRDPFSGWWEGVPVAYAWLQFVPLAKLAEVLGIPLIYTALLWRVVGGVLLGSALFVLFRRLFGDLRRPAAWALGAVLVCLADAGFVTGRTLVENFSLLPHLASGTTPLYKADALPQYRVVTPLLNLPFLLLLVAMVLPGRRRVLRAVGGGAALGACVLLYFYLWTAAVAALGLYGLWLLWLAWRRRGEGSEPLRELGVVTAIVGIGMAIGAPQIISNLNAFADPEYQPILHRLSKGYPLPEGDPIRHLYVRNLWVWLKLAAGAAGIVVLRRHPGLVVLWCFTFAGYALSNSAIVTGLEFENFHWAYVHAPIGAVLLLAVAVLWLNRYAAGRFRFRLLWSVPGVLLLIALAWRPYEALHAPSAVGHSRILRELDPIKPHLGRLSRDCALAGPPEAVNVALLFTRGAQLYQQPYTGHVSMVPDSVVHQRHALNAWMQGVPRTAYLEMAGEGRFAGGPFRRPEWEPEAVVLTRASIFDSLDRGGGDTLMERFRPCYLLLPQGSPPPARGGNWRLLDSSPAWDLWSRAPLSPVRQPGTTS